jgi:hypothetical protein
LLREAAADKVSGMKAIPLEEMSTRRDEILAVLAHGETLAVIDRGREIGTLSPRHSADRGSQPSADDAFYRLAGLAPMSTDDGAPLSDAEMDRLIYFPSLASSAARR